MDHLFSAAGIVSLLTLTVLEIVLGIDNLIFISILVGKLPAARQSSARTVGLSFALILRILFLFAASFIAGLTTPWITLPTLPFMDHALAFSGRDLIMLAGGLFLLAKATTELHNKLEGEEENTNKPLKSQYTSVVLQVVLLDLVFSIDSVITAIGLSQNLLIMVIAVVIAVLVMQFTSRALSNFIQEHPSIKILALAFLLMVGLLLTLEGFHVEVPKGYVYFAMAFSVGVEALNMVFRKKSTASKPLELRQPPYGEEHLDQNK